jgi:hypothetical protein
MSRKADEEKHCWKPVVLLPAAAERLVKLNQALIFIVSGLRQREFRLEQRPLAIEDV